MPNDGYISDDNLERYALGAVKDEGELADMEEHFLIQGQCVDRAENTEGSGETMPAARRRLQVRKQ
jgi:hypothetical protein